MRHDNNLNGDITQQIFVIECMKRGLSPLRPVQEGLRYDLAVDNNSKIYRVQVKMAWTLKRENCENREVIYLSTGRKCNGKYFDKLYDINDFDILAVYNKKLDVFYIVPMSKDLISKRKFICSGKNEKYINAWHYLQDLDNNNLVKEKDIIELTSIY